ncbi:uncharacterized protein I206_100232 [Kwoniella pini CBS 10737]|uniref:C2H2-type domain-containing protein n=1 Tax=Kwoniella pini CBS 10737 TaxID=1296096 RepID=A0A1B9IE07_9TREE|nr:uncharacterized protein I206_01093 [Kwoniella pini CBS 10737]OCF53786.1 hypothetical protein I206_01093 [Kwoniella pini CBS 10737]
MSILPEQTTSTIPPYSGYKCPSLPVFRCNRYQPYPPSSSSSANILGPVNLLATMQRPLTNGSVQSYIDPKPDNHLSKVNEKGKPKPDQSRNPSSGRYQPSKGARRDAKYSKKVSAKAKAQAASMPTSGLSGTNWVIASGTLPNGTMNREVGFLPLINRTIIPQSDDQSEQFKREQVRAIEIARRDHMKKLKAEELRAEEEKKTSSIRTQVHVHARQTPCAWNGCEAVLHSQAILEKHIHHCHLHPLHTPAGAVKCDWMKCEEIFTDSEECEKHVLNEHLTRLEARCPFNCPFEGDSFPSLMAHIGRRHPKATPEDFMPGLILHRPQPQHLPPLPPLPSLSGPENHYPTDPIRPFNGIIGKRVQRKVLRDCFAGKNPSVDCGKPKKGARATVCKRGKAIPGKIELDVENEKAELDEPQSVELVKIPNSAIQEDLKDSGNVGCRRPSTASEDILLSPTEMRGKSSPCTRSHSRSLSGSSVEKSNAPLEGKPNVVRKKRKRS